MFLAVDVKISERAVDPSRGEETRMKGEEASKGKMRRGEGRVK